MLTDGPFNNLRFESIVSSLPDSDSNVSERFDDLRQKHDELRLIRNKLYSHRDEDSVYDVIYGRENVVKSVFDLHVLKAIDAIGDLSRTMLNRIGVLMPLTIEIDAHEMIESLESSGTL